MYGLHVADRHFLKAFTMSTSALCHDFDHPGYKDAYQVNYRVFQVEIYLPLYFRGEFLEGLGMLEFLSFSTLWLLYGWPIYWLIWAWLTLNPIHIWVTHKLTHIWLTVHGFNMGMTDIKHVCGWPMYVWPIYAFSICMTRQSSEGRTIIPRTKASGEAVFSSLHFTLLKLQELGFR